MKIRFENARLIDPETGTDTLGSLCVADGVIVEGLRWKMPRAGDR